MKLSDVAIRQAKPLDKPYKLPDGTGLYLLVNKSGKYWRYDYRFEGKRKTIAYGVYPVVEFLKAVSLRRPFLCSLLIRHRGDILRDYAWAISMV